MSITGAILTLYAALTINAAAVEIPPATYNVPLERDVQLHVIDECEEHNIDPVIVFAIIEQESRYTADVIGDSGNSLGLMQIQPRWHEARMEQLGCTDLLDPKQNVTVGVNILAELLERYDGNVEKALTAYNRGHYSGTVSEYTHSVLERAEAIERRTRGEV